MKNITKTLAIATTILLSGAVIAPANAAPPKEPTTTTAEVPLLPQPAVAATTASLSFEAPKVATVAAPIPEPVPVPQVTAQSLTVAQPAPQYAPQYASQTAKAPVAATPKAPTVAPQSTPSPPAAPVAATGSGTGAALLASAYGQVGQIQDCTAMVERALGSVGIPTGDLAPAQFFRFGSVVGTPAPGDIIISAGHVGIYAGNGQMVSGGFNGNQTKVHPISYVGGFSAVRVA